MPDYSIIVQFPSLTLVDMSAAEIRDALQTLEGDDRLDASAVSTPGLRADARQGAGESSRSGRKALSES